MSLRETLENKNKKKISVHINEIRTNQMNRYPMDSIEELALQISTMKEQLQPGEAYQDDLNDGKRFTLTSGERRYRAIKLLYAHGEHDGMMDLIIIEKPCDIWNEKRRIRAANTYRSHTPETRMMEIKECEEEYRYLVSVNQKPAGLKRDWIGRQLGIDGRTVDRYLEKDRKVNDTKQKPQEREENDPNKMHLCKSADRLQTLLQTKTTIKKHYIQIYYDDISDLNRILEKMGALEKGLSNVE